MDVSTGDVITPGAEKHVFIDMFDESVCFELWSYPVETVLAEKIETVLSRGIDNTRPRDFYDVYALSMAGYDKTVFREAFSATALHRGSLEKITDVEKILQTIADDPAMQKRWADYTIQAPYASEIEFSETLKAIQYLMKQQ